MEDLTDMRFGKWTVLERSYDKSKSKGAKWLCKCDCGTKRIIFGKYLRNGKSKSCGCLHKREWIGERFGNLVIKSFQKRKGGNIYHCLCDCGNVVDVIGSSIYTTKSCGCSRRSSHVGERYGMLIINEMLYNMNGDNITYVSCSCDCGKAKHITSLASLRTGNTKSCGCVHNPDLTGKKFGRLTVIRQVHSSTPQRKWLCQCECGSKVELVSHLILSGHTQSCGCLRSEKNSRGEMFIRKALDKFNVQYIPEHSFNDCFGINGGHLRFDFYLPKHNIVIEFDGKQHFHPIEYWGGNQAFEIRKQNDNIKSIYCKEKHILLLRLPYTKSKDDIIEQISTYINI